jgi:formylglycine-generating enzyme required for sulfatase activity
MSFIFISYSHRDSAYVQRLAASIAASGLEAWIDERIDYGSNWPRVIQEQIDRCGAFVVVMTPDAFASKWVQNELAYAGDQDKPIFPLLLEGRRWLAVAALQVVEVTGGALPPARFYDRLTKTLSGGISRKSLTPEQATELRRGGLLDRLDLNRQQLQYLEEQKAAFGLYTPPYIEIGIKKAQAEIERIEQELAFLEEPEAQAPEPPPKQPEPTPAQVKELKPSPAQVKQPAPTPPQKQPAPDILTIATPIHMELMHIPEGEFTMGTRPEDIPDLVKRYGGAEDYYKDETPQHPVWVAEFYIGKFPVTNTQYAEYVKAAKAKAPEHWKNGVIPSGKADHPVVNVTWHDSMAFCRWLSQASGQLVRLPNEFEWKKPARGTDGRIFPWGNDDPTAEVCNFSGSRIGDTTPVDRYPKGINPSHGVWDMAGNVWEWTGSVYAPYPYKAGDARDDPNASGARVVRGGSFDNNARDVRCAVRHWPDPLYRYWSLGLRVVVGAPRNS